MDHILFLKAKQYWLPLTLGLMGFVLLLYGLISFASPPEDKEEVVFASASKSLSPDIAKVSDKKLVVDVAGAVEKPGVYELHADARVQDALNSAGGMSKDADREKVAKTLNLAAKVADGGKVYIPFVGETTGPALLGGGQTVLGTESSSGAININSASASELDKLPGIGAVTAEKIIINRPYGTLEELVQKKVMSQKVFEGIKERLSIH